MFWCCMVAVFDCVMVVLLVCRRVTCVVLCCRILCDVLCDSELLCYRASVLCVLLYVSCA